MTSRLAATELERLGRAVRRELSPLLLRGIKSGDFYGDFGGACAIVSYTMYRVLRKQGLEPTLALAGGRFRTYLHCWVEVDGFIVDLTATQFGYKRPVQVVTRPSEWHKPLISRGRRVITEVKGWHGQSPLRHRHTIDSVVNRVMETS